MLRISRRLAGYGFTVVAPEIYHQIEAPGTVFDFEADRSRALEASGKLPTAAFDRDTRILLDFLTDHPRVAPGQIAAAGFCFGGHLAFRAGFQPEVQATACFYPTGLHDDKLGSDPAESLGRAAEIRGKLLVGFGTLDPHIPEPGRIKIGEALSVAGIDHEIRTYEAEHTFMRDEGARHDPEAADLAFAAMIGLFRGVFG
jgi:carboxymethylenebutenolidase